MHLHHIIPRADGGPDEIDNAIPVCLDCHAEIESRSNMGRRFSQAELREHKRRWLEICRDNPEVLIRAGRQTADTGPLEAVLSELEYNTILMTGDDHLNDYAMLVSSQFERALAANAFAALDRAVRDQICAVYKAISETADLIRARMSHPQGSNPYNVMSNHIRDRRLALRRQVPPAITSLRAALGGNEGAA